MTHEPWISDPDGASKGVSGTLEPGGVWRAGGSGGGGLLPERVSVPRDSVRRRNRVWRQPVLQPDRDFLPARRRSRPTAPIKHIPDNADITAYAAGFGGSAWKRRRWRQAVARGEAAERLVPPDRREFFRFHCTLQASMQEHANRMLIELPEGSCRTRRKHDSSGWMPPSGRSGQSVNA